jgi:uncharacterized small protein (DUF1192 family)
VKPCACPKAPAYVAAAKPPCARAECILDRGHAPPCVDIDSDTMREPTPEEQAVGVRAMPEPARDVAAELREEIAALKQENARLRAGLAHHDAGIAKARRSIDDARGFLLEAGGALVAIGLRHEEQAAEIAMPDREALGRMAHAVWWAPRTPRWENEDAGIREDFRRLGETLFKAGMDHVLKIREGR